MKAIVIKKFGDESVLKMEDVKTPSPKEKEVKIRIKAVGFNPVDYKIREGYLGGDLPIILGTDCSGVIDEIGNNVFSLKKGNEVFAMSFIQCSNGSYAEYVCLPEELVYKKPKNLSFEEASVIPLSSMTAYRAMIANRSLKEKDSIFITAIAGGVGSFALQFARLSKVKNIFTIARDEKSKKFLIENLKIEPSHILIYENLSIKQMKDKLIEMNNNNLFDATYDFVGNNIKKLCLELTGYSGHFTTILPETDNFTFPIWNGLCFERNISIHQVNVGSQLLQMDRKLWQIYHQHLKYISMLLENKDLSPPNIQVLSTFNLESIKKAHQLLKDGSVKGKLSMTLE